MSAEIKKEAIVIKKYANRRLYDTSISKYITLDDLCTMVKQNVDFVVHDAKTNEDLTRSVLTQIIFEQEARGYNLLPINFLRRIIGFYDDSLRTILPTYLESMMDNFANNQDKMRSYMGKLEEFSPFKQFEQLGRQNIEIMEKMFSMFSPFNPMAQGQNPADKSKKD
ncbi:MAG: polyhydroxyalkanoate synthesis repressor PhaR [Proteobacteria bacterium]|nr:polyhydroxyalkanoate synthesis repressor PhaR [Pseudomonadota bacterium]